MEYTQDDKALEEYLKGMSAPGAAPATVSSGASPAASPAHPIAVAPTASVSATPAKKIERRKINLLFKASEATLKKEADPGKPDYENMDSSFVDPTNGATGTLDGLGATTNGASQFVAPLIKAGLAVIPKQISEKNMGDAVADLIEKTNKKLLTENTNKSLNSETTLVFTKTFTNEKGENKLIVANVGDSRVIVIRDGKIIFQTIDQKSYNPNLLGTATTYTEGEHYKNLNNFIEKVKLAKKTNKDTAIKSVFTTAQKIAESLPMSKTPETFDATELAFIIKELEAIGLSKDDLGNNEAGFYPIIKMQSEGNNFTAQAMGADMVRPWIDIIDIVPGDLVMSFSDGVTGNFTDTELLEIVKANKPMEVPAVIKKIMEDRISGKSPAVYARTKKDDVTLTVLEVGQELLDKITFTNRDLLGFLNFRKDFGFNFTTTGNISQNLGVTHDLAYEILTRGLMVGIDGLHPIIKENNIDNDAVDAFERRLIAENKLNEVFVLPPPFKTVLETEELIKFIINKKNFRAISGDSLTAEEIQKAFNISPDDAKIIIKDLEGFGALVDNKLASVAVLNSLKSRMIATDSSKYNMLEKPAPSTVSSVPGAGNNPATDTNPTAGVGTAPATPAVVPGASVEKGAFDELYTALKTYTGKIVKNKPAIITLVLFAAFTGAKILESKKEIHSENNSQSVTAPAQGDSNKSIKAGGISGKPQASTLEGLNPNFENTRWWKELDQETQINIKWLLGTNDPQAWALKFFERVEVLNERDKHEMSRDEQIFLYNKLVQPPSFMLNTAYNTNNDVVSACIIKMKDTDCYVKENMTDIIKEIYKIFRSIDPQNLQDDLRLLLEDKNIAQTFIWAQNRIETIMKANTAK